ncbi:DUF6683 family protein [Chitinophaga qingshengii]|uniref:DUF4197 family protein n=1 Tax=Chitinophaga qingshengii TaxID=1569794 RepID=A0ABR7TSU6_9BACT|nr:DUF6683 family protein [Chitinophaga qingshengii]MBC9932725.1 hypothetical protein [Chitinophaga qingshengii]
MKRTIRCLLFVITGFISPSLSAQDIYISAYQGAVQTSNVVVGNILREDVVNEELESRTHNRGKQANIFAALPPAKPSSVPVKIRSGNFTPDPAVTQKVNATFIAQIAKASPDKKNEIAKIVNGGALQQEASRRLTNLGLNINNIVDVTVTYYTLMWQIINGKAATDKQIIAGYNQLAPGLSASTFLNGMSDRQKQEVSGNMVLVAMFAMTTYQGLAQRHDTRNLQRLQKGINDMLLQQQIDLSSVHLTDAGWVKK